MMPPIVRSISAAASHEYAAMTPDDNINRSSLLITSPSQCLSGSAFPDSDTGYFGSPGLYEGSCDHLDYDYGRRYSVEMTDDVEVFAAENARISCSSTALDSFIVASSSKSKSPVPGGLKVLETRNNKQLDVAGIDVNSEIHRATCDKTIPLSEQAVAGTNLSLKICQDIHLSADVSSSDQPQTAEAVGLSEVAGRYTTVQLLLEMNRQRADMHSAEQLLLDRSVSKCESFLCVDRTEMASLATDYPVINECLQLGRVTSKQITSDNSSLHFETLTSESSHLMSEKPQAVENSADAIVGITAVKDSGGSFSYDDQVPKDSSIVDSEPLDRCVSHKSDGISASVALLAQREPSLMYMATEQPHYYPVYSRLRDVETGILNIYPQAADEITVKYGLLVASGDVEQLPRNTDQASVHYAADTVQHLHYASLALLSDVESGKLPWHSEVDVHSAILPLHVGKTLLEQRDKKQMKVLESETVENNVENQELSDEKHHGVVDLYNDSHADGFTVVKTKRHRRQRKKRDFEDAATKNSSVLQRSTSLSESCLSTVELSEADAKEAEQCTLAQQSSASDATEEGLVQNFLHEVNPAITDIFKSEDFSSLLHNDLGMKVVSAPQDVVSENVIMNVTLDHGTSQKSEAVESLLSPTATDRLQDAAKQQSVAVVGHQIADEKLSYDTVPADVESLPINVAVVESEGREQVVSDILPSVDNIGTSERIVTSVAVELHTEAVAIAEITAVKQRAVAAASSSNETVRVERLTTVAPRLVVVITGEPYSNVTDKNVPDVKSADESAMENGRREQVENKPEESIAQSIHDADGCISALGERHIEMDVVSDSKMNQNEVCEMVTIKRDLEMSENENVEKKLFETKFARIACMPCDEAKTEKVVSHYTSLAALVDVESGKVHNRLKAHRFLWEWDAENIDDIVAYIIGSGTTKHRRRHKRVKRASEGEFSEVKATESGSEMMKCSKPRARSEEKILYINEQPDQSDAVESDVDDQTIEDDIEGESFTVVETRKHRRLRQRHDTNEMCAHYMDDADTSGYVIEQNEIEYSADSLHCPTYNDRETVLESGAVSADESVTKTEAKPLLFATNEELETVHDVLDAQSSDVSAKCATESQRAAELACGYDHDTKFYSLAEDAKDASGIHDPIAESVVPQPQVEIHKDAVVMHAPSATEPVEDTSVLTKAASIVQDVTLEHNMPRNDSRVARQIDNRLYSDVARGKYDDDGVVSEPWRGTVTDPSVEVAVGMHVNSKLDESIVASSAEFPVESVENVWPEPTSVIECELRSKVPSHSLVTDTPVVSTDVDVAVGEYVSKCVTVKTELLSEVPVLSCTHDATWSNAETREKDAQPTEHSVEVPFTKQEVELHNAKPGVAQQQPEGVNAIDEFASLVDLKPDDEMSKYDVTARSTELIGAVLPLSAYDVHKLPMSSHLLSSENLPEPSATEPDVEPHVFVNENQVSDVGTVTEASAEYPCQDAEDLESSVSCSVIEVPSDTAVELPEVEIRSTEEPSVTALAEQAAFNAESARDPTVALHVADVAVRVVEDKQHVARLFSEGLRAVQIRSDLAAATGTVTVDEMKLNLPVEITDSRSEDASKKTVLSSVESFVAEILPSYYAALAALQDTERGTIQLPCDPSLQAVSKTAVEMPHDTSDFTVSVDDLGLPDKKSQKIKEFVTEKEMAVQEAMPDDESHPFEAAGNMSVTISERSVQLPVETVQPAARKYLPSVLPTGVGSKDSHLLDNNHTDGLALQSHYQSLKLLHSVETGDLPALSALLAACSGHGSTIIEQARDTFTMEQFKRESTNNFAEEYKTDLECKALRPVEDVSPNDVNIMSAEHLEQPIDSIKPATLDLLAIDSSSPAALPVEHTNVGISSIVDNQSEVQTVLECHAEHDSCIALRSDSGRVISEHGHDMPSSSLLLREPASELHIQTVDNTVEIDIVGESLQDNSDISNYILAAGDTSDSLSLNQCPQTEDSVSADLIQQLASDFRVCDLPLQQEQTDAGKRYTEQHDNQEVSCFNEQPLSDNETMNMEILDESNIPTMLEQPEKSTKKKRNNRKKKPKSTKDDTVPLAATSGCDDLPAVNQMNTVTETVSVTCFSAATQLRNIDEDDVHTTTSTSTEAPGSASLKKNKKRKRNKDRQVATDDVAIVEQRDALQSADAVVVQSIVGKVRDHICEEQNQKMPVSVADTRLQQDEVEIFKEGAYSCNEIGYLQPLLPPISASYSASAALPPTTTDDVAIELQLTDRKLTDRTPSYEESMTVGSLADVASMPGVEEDSVELYTCTLDVQVSDSAMDGKKYSSTKPIKRKNQKKCKPKTTQIRLHEAAITESNLNTVYDNATQDSLIESRDQLDSVVAEADEIMTESLEEDTKITEQPLDVLSMDDNKEMSVSSLFSSSPIVSATAVKKKKKRKAKASDIALPCMAVGHSSDCVTESSNKAKGDVSKKDKLSAPSELEPTDFLETTLDVTMQELENTKACLFLSRDEERNEAEGEREGHFENESNGESSDVHASHTTELAADNTAVSVTSSKQKKKRKRNRQKKIYQKETCSDAETDTDLCSLLTRIVEICTETKDGQTAADDNQTRYSHEPGKHLSLIHI